MFDVLSIQKWIKNFYFLIDVVILAFYFQAGWNNHKTGTIVERRKIENMNQFGL
jgi:hypothetical protein